MVITNGFDTKPLSISPSASIFTKNEIDCNMLTIENVYKLTDGKISFSKAKKTTEFIYSLALSKKHALEYGSIIYDLTGDTSLLDRINNEVFAIDSKIIDRSNNSGYRLCESVNIGMSNEKNSFYSIKDQKKLIESFCKFNLDGVDKVLNNNPETFIKSISTILKSDSMPKEEYYARAILEQIDYKKIFTYSKDKDNFSKSEEEKLINSLSVKNIDRLYNAFSKLKVSDSDISAYIVNLLLEGEYKDYSFEQICNLDNIDSFIEENIHKLNLKINPMILNEFFGIDENNNRFEGTNLVLRDYQMSAKENADKIYESGKRFCGVVLPTGAGKSFIIMAEMLERRNQNIVYIAPRIGIIRQLKKNIVKYIAGLDPLDYSDVEQDLIVKKYFPHFECYCYQGLDPSDEEKLKKYSADFIILDEIHHLGAETWNPAIRDLLNSNKNSKVLGVTATPERDDRRYNNDMLYELADLLDNYTDEELKRKKYLASNMSLVEAIQEGYVVCPNIVSFDYYLDETKEYTELLDLISKTKDPRVRVEIQKKFAQLEDVISKAKLEGVDEVFKKYIKDNNGKFILFIPRKNGEGSDSIEYIEKYIEEFKKELQLVDSDPIISYIFSTKSDNSETIREFEKENVTGHLKILAAVDMFNEGIHLEKLSGSFNNRKIDVSRRILKFQHLGRVVYGIDPNNPPKEEDRPIVFDRYNNYYSLEFEREINRTTISSDLDKLRNVIFWIGKYGYIPQTDAHNLSEVRKALTLKKLKAKYIKYIEDSSKIKDVDKDDRYELEQIIELGKSIDLWNMEFAEIENDKERTIEHVELIKVGGTRRTFLELYSSIKQIQGIGKYNNKDRLKLLRFVLDVLLEYNIDVGPKYIHVGDTLEDLLKNVNPEARRYILNEISSYGLNNKYAIGIEYYNIRDLIAAKKPQILNIVLAIDNIKEFVKNGILTNGDDYSFHDERGFLVKLDSFINIYTCTAYDLEGFDLGGLDAYSFDREGMWINHGVKYPYNSYGFMANRLHHKTNTEYDPHGFNIDKKYKDTGERVNNDFFNIDGFYCIKIEDGYKVTGTKYNPEGYDIDGFDRSGFNKEGIHKETGLPYDENFFDKNHFYWKLVNGKRVRTNSFLNEEFVNYCGVKYKYSETKQKYVIDTDAKRNRGFYGKGHPKEGLHRITGTKYDPYGFDIKGFWHRYNEETGEYEETGLKENPEGWNAYGERITYNVHGYPSISTVDEYGFDIDGYFHPPIVLFDENGYVNFHGGQVLFPKSSNHLQKYDVHGFDKDGIHRDTGTFLNPENFDRRGYWYIQDENGEYVNTYKFENDEGWTIDKRHREFMGYKSDGTPIVKYSTTIDGFNADGEKLTLGLTETRYIDKHGFYDDGIHYITHTHLDEYGFDKQGFWHYVNENGEEVNSGSFKNDEGWTIDHEYIEDYIDENGNKIVKFKKLKDGFDYNGMYHDSRGRISRYNPQGFDKNGIHYDTGTELDPRNFDASGYWYEEKDGKFIKTNSRFDSTGWSQTGVNRHTHRIVDKHGFNFKHFYRKKDGTFSMVDLHGFDYEGIHQSTGTRFNKKNFDQDGYWYEEVDGMLVCSGSLFDKDGYNINGLDRHGFRRTGTYTTGGKYNPQGFDCHGIHRDTNRPYNLEGITIDGEKALTVDWNLIKKIKNQEIFYNKMDLETLFDLMDPDDRKQAAYSVDPDTYEIEDEDTFDIFFENVSKYCINEYNEKYSEDDVLEFLVEKRREFDEEYYNDSRLEYYLYSQVVDSDEDISINKYI